MSQIYPTGTWTPKTGREAEFVAAWHEFAPNRRHHDFQKAEAAAFAGQEVLKNQDD